MQIRSLAIHGPSHVAHSRCLKHSRPLHTAHNGWGKSHPINDYLMGKILKTFFLSSLLFKGYCNGGC